MTNPNTVPHIITDVNGNQKTVHINPDKVSDARIARSKNSVRVPEKIDYRGTVIYNGYLTPREFAVVQKAQDDLELVLASLGERDMRRLTFKDEDSHVDLATEVFADIKAHYAPDAGAVPEPLINYLASEWEDMITAHEDIKVRVRQAFKNIQDSVTAAFEKAVAEAKPGQVVDHKLNIPDEALGVVREFIIAENKLKLYEDIRHQLEVAELEEESHPYITEYGMSAADAKALVEVEHLSRVVSEKVHPDIAGVARQFSDAAIAAHLNGEPMKKWAKSKLGEFTFIPPPPSLEEVLAIAAANGGVYTPPFRDTEDYADKFVKIHSQFNRYF